MIKSRMGNYAILYPYQVFGNEAGRPSGYSVPTRILRGELDSIFDPWERDYIHVDDVVQMVLKVIDDNLDGEYDLGRGIGVSNKELFDYAKVKGLTLAHPGDKGYPVDAHPSIIARKDMIVPDVEFTKDVKAYMYYTRGLRREPFTDNEWDVEKKHFEKVHV